MHMDSWLLILTETVFALFPMSVPMHPAEMHGNIQILLHLYLSQPVFNTSGEVVSGPADSSLAEYSANKNGDIIKITKG